MTKDVFVYVDWQGLKQATLVGVLKSDVLRNKEHFSFQYADSWLQNPLAQTIDPSLHPCVSLSLLPSK